MLALFGTGRHPEADRIEAEAIAEGASKKEALKRSMLGREYRDPKRTDFHTALYREYRKWNESQGRDPRAAVPEEVRAEIRTRLGRESFVAQHERDPLTKQEFDGHLKQEMRGERKSIAGFDMTFSPVKSVSALWAVAPMPVAQVIASAHDDAVRDAIAWVEKEMLFTRRGVRGARQVETRGLLAGMFVHRDSRAGDPDLHTHVAIANKVQAVEDGAWLAIDGRQIYQAMVSVSERYNSTVEQLLTQRLGVVFQARPARGGRRPVREIVGVPETLLAAWSSRRAAIETRVAQLEEEFEEHHGRLPTPKEALALAQQATLETRPEKDEPRSYAQQREEWREQAARAMGGAEAVDAMTRGALGRAAEYAVADRAQVHETVEVVTAELESRRASFQVQHVTAEAERQARALGIRPEMYREFVDQVVDEVIRGAIAQSRPDVDDVAVPEVLRRSDGTSQYVRAHSQRYTTRRIIEAEEYLQQAARTPGGCVVTDTHVDAALAQSATAGVKLNPAQANLVRSFATNGSRLQLALAPAGTGKTTAMGVLATAWQLGGGHVVALGPTHVAADGLRAAMGVDGGTVSALVHAIRTDSDLPEWAQQISTGSLVVVDEAGMVGTFDLAVLVHHVLDCGGSVRLIGDHQQLAAVAAGGVLRDFLDDPFVPVVSLDELVRFTDPAEGRATLAVRDGDHSALGFYLDHDRVHPAPDATAPTSVFEAWRADTEKGFTSVMLAATKDQVAQLNTLARRWRVATGHVDQVATVSLNDGTCAGVGDLVVTRTNDRRLRVSGTDWVKNRDRWTVVAVGDRGSLRVRGQRHGRVVTLPPEYVAESVELGYASTVHAAQGLTVDTSHALINGTETRQLLYVAVSRGQLSNQLWVSVPLDESSEITPTAQDPETAVEVLEEILNRDGQALSVITQTRIDRDPAELLGPAADAHLDAVFEGLNHLVPERQRNQILEHVLEWHPGAQDERGWPQLQAQLMFIAMQGEDPIAKFDEALASRPLDGVRNPVAVMSYRLAEYTLAGQGPLPHLWAVPESLHVHPVWGPYLDARTKALEEYVTAVHTDALHWTYDTAPIWARPYLRDPHLVSALAVWRATVRVPESDPTPLGPTAMYVHERDWQDDLQRRVDAYIAKHDPMVEPLTQRVPQQVTSDPYWSVVGRRLAARAAAGEPISDMLDQALAEPLPVNHAAAALWYRLNPGPDTPGATQPWIHILEQRLKRRTLDRAVTAPSWSTLTSVLRLATSEGYDPAVLIDHAIDRLPRTLDPEGIGALLAARITDVIAPADADPITELYDPETEIAFAHLSSTRPEVAQEPVTVSPETHVNASDVHAGTAATSKLHVDAALDPDEPAAVALGVQDTSYARIVELHQQAAKFYHHHYASSSATHYLTDRLGTDLTTVPGVVVGYAPRGNKLQHHLRNQGASADELVAAGLAKWTKRGELQDVFRDRLVLGIHNTHGDLVGFTGRCAPGAPPHVPKYLNTPQTLAFTKGEVLFGLHEGRERLAAEAPIVRVEGAFDALAISLYTDAVGVAPLGTALTQAQTELLAHHRDIIWEAVDQDPAGAQAAAKDLARYTAAGITARQLLLVRHPSDPEKTPVKDPAELASRPHGREQLALALLLGDSAPTLTARVLSDQISRWGSGLSYGHARAVVGAAREAAALIFDLPPAEWSEHVNLTADLINDLSPNQDITHLKDLLTIELNNLVTPPGADPYLPPPRQTPPRAASRAEQLRKLEQLQEALNRHLDKSTQRPDASHRVDPPSRSHTHEDPSL